MGQRWSLRQIDGDRLEPTTTDLAPALSQALKIMKIAAQSTGVQDAVVGGMD